ncbi:Hypothetical protein (plasmid) [Pseudomonas putida]|nr:Hypothetical protein [Pseudomonas putida]
MNTSIVPGGLMRIIASSLSGTRFKKISRTLARNQIVQMSA